VKGLFFIRDYNGGTASRVRLGSYSAIVIKPAAFDFLTILLGVLRTALGFPPKPKHWCP
jgi:hypothetical protein